MGYLVEKYNEAYFLRKDINGNPLPYGVEGIESFEKGNLREHDLEILSRINFSGANVLEFGFGRGETVKYIWEQGAARYTGVDFSEAACNIAQGFFAQFSVVGPQIICSDAAEFVQKLVSESTSSNFQLIDAVVMLDFVEHIPRVELVSILKMLRPLLSAEAVIIVNTPDFPFDNDVIADGLNEKGLDSSDLVEETKGMHCNRYTLNSLRSFFDELGYKPVSRGHYFTLSNEAKNPWQGQLSYRAIWNEACKRSHLLKGEWVSESFEVAYEGGRTPELHHFDEGNLNGINLYVASSYLEYYDKGDYDQFLIQFISKFDLTGKVIFDLGGFVGVNSMQFARLVGDDGIICAFEPNPFNADRMRLNLSENPPLDDRIKVFPFALSNEKGRTQFNAHRNVDAGLSSASYLQGAHTTMSETQLGQLGFTDVAVDVLTLDEFVLNTDLIPACIKIDIEGAEHLALAGALGTLGKYRPVLLIELHSIYCAIATLNILIPIGYQTELLYIEPDGRCFIGAVSTKANSDVVNSQPTLSVSDIHQNLMSLEYNAVRSKNRSLVAELGKKDCLFESLKEELVKNNHLTENLKEERAQNIAQLEQQIALNNTLNENLTRYQMFPLIRLVRKLRRIFS